MEHPLGNQTAICCHDVWAILEERRQAEEERRDRPRSGIQSQSDGSAAIRRLLLLWTASCDLAYETEYFIEATQIYSEEDRKRRSVKGKERKGKKREGKKSKGKERGGEERKGEGRKREEMRGEERKRK